jgi:hypothetical protein
VWLSVVAVVSDSFWLAFGFIWSRFGVQRFLVWQVIRVVGLTGGSDYSEGGRCQSGYGREVFGNAEVSRQCVARERHAARLSGFRKVNVNVAGEVWS